MENESEQALSPEQEAMLERMIEEASASIGYKFPVRFHRFSTKEEAADVTLPEGVRVMARVLVIMPPPVDNPEFGNWIIGVDAMSTTDITGSMVTAVAGAQTLIDAAAAEFHQAITNAVGG